MSRFKMPGRKIMPEYEIRERAISFCMELNFKFISIENGSEGYSAAKVRIIDNKGKESVKSMQNLYSRVRNLKKPNICEDSKVIDGKKYSVINKLDINRWKKRAELANMFLVEVCDFAENIENSRAMLISKRTKMSRIYTFKELGEML